MNKPDPKLGDTNIYNTFLIFPRRINNETRWLEKATIKERYIEKYNPGDYGESFYYNGWQDESWEN